MKKTDTNIAISKGRELFKRLAEVYRQHPAARKDIQRCMDLLCNMDLAMVRVRNKIDALNKEK